MPLYFVTLHSHFLNMIMNMKRILLALVMTVTTLSASAQLLYRISGHGLKSPSYIVGTYHLANVSFVDSIPGMRKAMADCQQVYGELVMDNLLGPDSVAIMEKAMMLPDGMTLNNLLSDDEMSRLNAYLKELIGMDLTNPLLAQQMSKLSPAALNTALSVLSFMKKGGNVDVQNGFDDYFQKEALAQGKGVGGLETMAFQVETLFKGTPLERQKELLMCLVDNAAFMDSSPEEEDKLIYNRNANWLKMMPGLMSQKSTLFAVGAGHLPGEKGVLNLLRQAGYTVEGVTATAVGQP